MSLIPNFDNAGSSFVVLNKAVASFYSTQNQLMTGGPAIPILFDTQTPGVSPVDISLNPVTGEVTFNRTGLYKVMVDINFSLTVPGPAGFACWLTVNGTAVPASHRLHNIENNPPTSSVHEWFVPITIGDVLTVDIGSSAGPTTVYIVFPPPIPDLPSAIVNILQID
jgi:hypothetical protein